MNRKERREEKQKIWLVPKPEEMKTFSILNSPALTFYNKEHWFDERRKDVLDKRLIDNRIF